MQESVKKVDPIEKYSEVFEAYALLDEYRKKHPSIEEAAERLASLKARAKTIPCPEDGTDAAQTYNEAVNKIEYAELKIKNTGDEVLPRLEESMLLWIDEQINTIAESTEEAGQVKTFFESGKRDQEAFQAMFDGIEQQSKSKETKMDSLFAQIIKSLDSLIKEINAVLDSIDRTLNEIETSISVEGPEVESKAEIKSEVSAENILSGEGVPSPLLETPLEENLKPAGPVRLSVGDLLQINEDVKRESGESEGGVISSDEEVELTQVASLFNTFSAGGTSTSKAATPGMTR